MESIMYVAKEMFKELWFFKKQINKKICNFFSREITKIMIRVKVIFGLFLFVLFLFLVLLCHFNKHNERMRECIRRIKISRKRREGSVCVGKVKNLQK